MQKWCIPFILLWNITEQIHREVAFFIFVSPGGLETVAELIHFYAACFFSS